MVSRQPQSKPDKSFFPQAVPARQPMADIYVRLPDLAVPRMGRQKWRLPVPIASTVSRLRRPFTNWVNPAVRCSGFAPPHQRVLITSVQFGEKMSDFDVRRP